MRGPVLIQAAFWAFFADQASKIIVVFWLGLRQLGHIDVLPPLLTFRYGENRGINFGLFQGDSDAARWVLIGLSLAICAGVVIWVRRAPSSKIALFSAGLLIGGAMGNVLDRLLYGYVIDFLNMSCCGINNPFVFNVADIFIFAGAIGLILFEGKGRGTENGP